MNKGAGYLGSAGSLPMVGALGEGEPETIEGTEVPGGGAPLTI